MPLWERAFDVDGGSEFFAEFEEACKHKGIRLFVLTPYEKLIKLIILDTIIVTIKVG